MNFENSKTNKNKVETENVEPKEVEEVTVEARVSIAKDQSTSPEILAKLSRDTSDEVREAVADNPNTPPGTLATLTKDPDCDVRSNAIQNLKNQVKGLRNDNDVEDFVNSLSCRLGYN